MTFHLASRPTHPIAVPWRETNASLTQPPYRVDVSTEENHIYGTSKSSSVGQHRCMRHIQTWENRQRGLLLQSCNYYYYCYDYLIYNSTQPREDWFFSMVVPTRTDLPYVFLCVFFALLYDDGCVFYCFQDNGRWLVNTHGLFEFFIVLPFAMDGCMFDCL